MNQTLGLYTKVIRGKDDVGGPNQANLNPIRPGLFGSIGTRGGQICPHPIKMGVMGGEFKN